MVKDSPLGIDALAVLDRKPASIEQLLSPCAASARSCPEPSDRRHERLPEDLIRHLTAKRLEQLEFVRRGRDRCHHIRILERRMGARIGAVHDGLVGPFEIEGIDQRLADPRILEFVAAGIDEPALRARRRFVRQRLALDAAVLAARENRSASPIPAR